MMKNEETGEIIEPEDTPMDIFVTAVFALGTLTIWGVCIITFIIQLGNHGGF